MKKAIIVLLCLLLLVSSVFAFGESITSNLIKLPLLKNLAAKNNVQPSNALPANQPPSEDSMVLKEGSAFNRKDAGKYYAKQAFLVSDKDWHNVLSLVPVSLWYEGTELKKYPVLIYHEEDNGFDADSAINFLKQYGSKKVVLVGDTPEELDNILIADGYTYLLEAEVALLTPSLIPVTGRPIADIPGILPPGAEAARAPTRGIDLTPNWLTRISPDDYTRHWSSYNTVVVCEDNYQLGLLASVYAAYLNAPLFFEGRVPSDVSLARKRIVTVGRTSYTGIESYNLAQLEQKLARDYPTDKIILATPNDLSISETGVSSSAPYRTQLTGTQIDEIYSKTSLSAPFLAVAKKEILLTTTETAYANIDPYLEGKIASMGLSPKYLTIIAAPIAIQMDRKISTRNIFEEVDNHIYGDINGDSFIDIAVGRIMGITPSDVSAYIARDLFIEYFRTDRAFATLWTLDHINKKAAGKSTDRILRSAGLMDESIYLDNPPEPIIDAGRDFENKLFVSYMGDGFNDGAWVKSNILRSERIKMDPSIAMAHACLTCAYSEASLYQKAYDLFCANIIKQGAMAYIGAVEEIDIRTTPSISEKIAKAIIDGNDLGSAFLILKKNGEIYNRFAQWIWFIDSRTNYEPHFVLIGDPTVKLLPDLGVANEITFSESSAGNRKIIRADIRQPAEEIDFEATDEIGTTRRRAYVNPSGTALVYGERIIEYYSSDIYRYEPRLEDILYTETEAGFSITGAILKIRYSDGTERDMPLTLSEGMYSYRQLPDDRGIPPIQAHMLALRAGSKYKIGIAYMEEYMDFGKLMPGYSYELALETEVAA